MLSAGFIIWIAAVFIAYNKMAIDHIVAYKTRKQEKNCEKRKK